LKRENVDFILEAGYLLTMTDNDGPILDGAVAVRDGYIIEIGTAEEVRSRYEADTVIGGADKVIMPGLVNTHTHAAMVFFRGMADDIPLKSWLEEYIWPAEERWLGADFVRDATELACIEMLRAGITLYNDMYFYEDASAEAVKRVGMRAVLGAGVVDFPTHVAKTTEEYLKKAEVFINRWIDDELISPSIAPHAPYTCSPETYRSAMVLADRYDLTVHTHIGETRWEVEEIKRLYGRTPVEHLDAHGLLNDRVLAAHCVWTTGREIDVLADKGVSVSHCLKSNLKLASGIAPVVSMIDAGVRTTFGTDGAASNNNLDIFSEMTDAAKIHKAVSEDATVLSARTVLMMATRWGAEALGLGDRTGSLEKGKLADIIVIDLNKPHLIPIYDIYSHLVYSVRSSDVEAVMVNGRLLVNGFQICSVDEDEIIAKARAWNRKIFSDA
jgi:5-methylthioadenosine/S-adenosylhomocysteine deaminase